MRKIWNLIILLIGLLFFIAFLLGVWFGKRSPCTEVERVDMWKVPSEDAP
jgi:hypothetical protein